MSSWQAWSHEIFDILSGRSEEGLRRTKQHRLQPQQCPQWYSQSIFFISKLKKYENKFETYLKSLTQVNRSQSAQSSCYRSCHRDKRTENQSPRKATKSRKIPAIEREIRSIFRGLTANASEHEVIVIEKDDKGTYRKAMIRVYKQADLDRQKEEETIYRERLARGENRTERDKPYKAHPIVMYALYPDTYDSTKLGSIAIYGDDAPMRRTLILKQGSLFGRKVVSANLEMCHRLFVDVKLGA